MNSYQPSAAPKITYTSEYMGDFGTVPSCENLLDGHKQSEDRPIIPNEYPISLGRYSCKYYILLQDNDVQLQMESSNIFKAFHIHNFICSMIQTYFALGKMDL